MPSRFCIQCRAIHAGKCQARAKQYDVERGSNTERGYDIAWRKFRAAYLAEDPMRWLCVDCLAANRVTQMEELHHIRKVRTHPHLRLDPSNVMSLCGPCHSVRTGRGE